MFWGGWIMGRMRRIDGGRGKLPWFAGVPILTGQKGDDRAFGVVVDEENFVIAA
jgi:hypothetical protein